MLYSLTLKEDQVQALDELIELIKTIDGKQRERAQKSTADERRKWSSSGFLLSQFRAVFRSFLDERDAPTLKDPAKISAIFGPSGSVPKKHTEMSAALCDFFVYRFRREILDKRSDLLDAEHHDLSESLKRLVQSIKEGVTEVMKNPFSFLVVDMLDESFAEKVPEHFIGDFIGYRRSANVGDVIRFQFDIRRRGDAKDSRFVEYRNEYRRGNTHMFVKGGGVFVAGALYLFGHARDQDQSSLGYRTQVLVPLKLSKGVLLGPVLSRDDRSPIASRIVLVPYEAHAWTDQQKGLTDAKRKAALIAPPSRKTTDLAEYIHEIRENTDGAFFGSGDDDIFYYMSNLTEAVLKANPGYDNEFTRFESTARAFLFEKFQKALKESDKPPSYTEFLARVLAAADFGRDDTPAH